MSACRLSSPQKLDRVLLSYGFNSYRLRVNKLELELDVRLHALDLLRDRAAFITALVPGRARESVPSRADELVRAVLGVCTRTWHTERTSPSAKKNGLARDLVMPCWLPVRVCSQHSRSGKRRTQVLERNSGLA